MKIEILRSIAGVFSGEPYGYNVGDRVAVPDALAKDLIKAGHAKSAAPARTKAKRARK